MLLLVAAIGECNEQYVSNVIPLTICKRDCVFSLTEASYLNVDISGPGHFTLERKLVQYSQVLHKHILNTKVYNVRYKSFLSIKG